ncbi:MAG: AZOBR_p60025 family cell surface glycopolymer formation protein [Thermoanaerobaculum sp.]
MPRRDLRRPLLESHVSWAAAAVFIWIAVLATLTAGKYSGDLRGFLHVGSEFKHPRVFAPIPPVGPWGYDGQFYATLATDPFLRQPETASLLDNPRYRAQRIALPALAYLLALGKAEAATYTYPLAVWLTSFLGIGALAWLAKSFGVAPWWVLVAAFNAGFAASLTRSTPDAPALAFLLLGWIALRQGKLALATFFFMAAGLTRETSLLAVWALVAAELATTKKPSALAPAILPSGTVLLWAAYLAARFPHQPGGMGGNLGWPLGGLTQKVWLVARGKDVHAMEFLAFLGLLALLAAIPLVAKRPLHPRAVLYLGFGLLALSLTMNVYAEAFAFSRVLLPLPWTAVLLLPQAPRVRVPLEAGLLLQGLSGLSLVHGEYLAAGGLRHVLATTLRMLALVLHSR